jgi:hypothetical protein
MSLKSLAMSPLTSAKISPQPGTAGAYPPLSTIPASRRLPSVAGVETCADIFASINQACVCREHGETARSVVKRGVTNDVLVLRSAGYSATELADAGATYRQLLNAGFTYQQLGLATSAGISDSP